MGRGVTHRRTAISSLGTHHLKNRAVSMASIDYEEALLDRFVRLSAWHDSKSEPTHMHA